MKRFCRKRNWAKLLILGVCGVATSLFAEPKKSLLHNSWSLSSGFVGYEDSYLSNLKYKGVGFQWEAFHSNFYGQNRRVSWQNRNTFFVATALNPPFTSQILNPQVTLAFGTHYHFRPTPQFTILVGGFYDIDAGVKWNQRNVNNVVSTDVATNISVSAIFRYHLITKKLQMTFEYNVQTPVVGTMFVPEMGSSYYEYYLLQNLNNAIHFSSFHNKLGLKGNVSVDFLFKKFTLRVGFSHQNMAWKANNLRFSKESYLFSLGTVVDLELFGGRSHQKSEKTTIWGQNLEENAD